MTHGHLWEAQEALMGFSEEPETHHNLEQLPVLHVLRKIQGPLLKHLATNFAEKQCLVAAEMKESPQ